jgi:hypothetical protein
MAIILAFTSGLFGALLITLVIFVYPDSQFKFTKSLPMPDESCSAG